MHKVHNLMSLWMTMKLTATVPIILSSINSQAQVEHGTMGNRSSNMWDIMKARHRELFCFLCLYFVTWVRFI